MTDPDPTRARDTQHGAGDEVAGEQQLIQAQSAFFVGPLPPPSILQGYEDSFPGAGERILTMAEQAQRHRHAMESQTLAEEVASRKTGQFFAMIVTICAFAAATIVVAISPTWPGAIVASAIVSSTLAVIVIALITGKGEASAETRTGEDRTAGESDREGQCH